MAIANTMLRAEWLLKTFNVLRAMLLFAVAQALSAGILLGPFSYAAKVKYFVSLCVALALSALAYGSRRGPRRRAVLSGVLVLGALMTITIVAQAMALAEWRDEGSYCKVEASDDLMRNCLKVHVRGDAPHFTGAAALGPLLAMPVWASIGLALAGFYQAVRLSLAKEALTRLELCIVALVFLLFPSGLVAALLVEIGRLA